MHRYHNINVHAHASHGLVTMTINRCIHGTKDSGQTFENEFNQGLVTIKGSFHLSTS